MLMQSQEKGQTNLIITMILIIIIIITTIKLELKSGCSD
jgi:hypothetical protein